MTFKYYNIRKSVLSRFSGIANISIRFILKVRFIKRILKMQIRYKIVAGSNNNETKYRIVSGKTIIAEFNGTTGNWDLRSPYDLIFSAEEFPRKSELRALDI